MNYIRTAVLIIPLVIFSHPSTDFDRYFVDKTMRIDYFHAGDAREEFITLDQIYQQGAWAGNTHNLIDNFDNGRYYVKIYDFSSGELIFSKGFDCYFGEYKTTDKALKGIKRTYHETVLIPYPKKEVNFTLEARNRKNNLQPLFSQKIDPSGISIIKEKLDENVKIYDVCKNGDPHKKVDLAFIAEGYTLREEAKLKADLKRVEKIFFNQEPYKTFRDRFNIYCVFRPSEESGSDEPRRGIYKNTALNTGFNSIGLERYLLTEDNKTLRDTASNVPYDALVIIVNHSRYGGGGIYNLYCTFTADNQWFNYLFLHEFGHSFAGLADEYYTSTVAYNEFYPKGVEPTEPNITALLSAENLKWKDLAAPGIEIPTPWAKENFDGMDNDYQKVRAEFNRRIADMERSGAPDDEIVKVKNESDRLSTKHQKRMDAFLMGSKFWGKVGAFEGAGYSSRGLYRPMLDCIMFSKGAKPYCKVCERAVVRVIKHYSERVESGHE